MHSAITLPVLGGKTKYIWVARIKSSTQWTLKLRRLHLTLTFGCFWMMRAMFRKATYWISGDSPANTNTNTRLGHTPQDAHSAPPRLMLIKCYTNTAFSYFVYGCSAVPARIYTGERMIKMEPNSSALPFVWNEPSHPLFFTTRRVLLLHGIARHRCAGLCMRRSLAAAVAMAALKRAVRMRHQGHQRRRQFRDKRLLRISVANMHGRRKSHMH